MEYNVVHGSLTGQPSDVLIVNLFEGVKAPGGGTGAVDRALDGAITSLIEDGDFEGKLGETIVVRGCKGIPGKRVMLVGLGKSQDFGVPQVMRAAAAAARKSHELKARTVAGILHGAGIAGLPAFDCAKAVVQGTILGAYEYTRLKTQDVKAQIETFSIVEMASEKISEIERGARVGEVVGEAVAWARDLINGPSNYVDPSYLAGVARELADQFGFECRVRDRKEIEESGMGLVAAVSRGSSVEPRFIELKYDAPGASKTVAIVGKGVTFDAGGYSLKSSESMYGMKDDMAGAAAVLAAMRGVGKLKPNVSVLALVPAVENLIGATAIHPGDVFKSYGGKTVEINNTDAEGRLILADAVAYAREQNVDEIIDLATLTGACVVALGRGISGILSTSDKLAENLIDAGKVNGEDLWRLPLYDDYKEYLKSDVADLKNTGSREGGAINGALFIREFVGDIGWAHIDLSAAVADKDIDLARKGATGAGTGALIGYLMSL
jgi:leucyl aminopeptidase